MPAAHITVTGRVQGVGFRWCCQREARALGLAGWVRNAGDGSVEIQVEGGAAALEALLAWCHEGPDGARVARVRVNPLAAAGQLPQPFAIKF
jgi:acylphosphatase